MTPDQALAYIALGDRRHGDAPADECGATDPRAVDEKFWCRRPNDGRCKREGWHCCYRLDEDWKLNRPDLATSLDSDGAPFAADFKTNSLEGGE